MKIALVGVLIIATIGLSAQQNQAQSPCRDSGRLAADVMQQVGAVPDSSAQVVAAGTRMGFIERIRKQTGIGVTADCIESRSQGFRAQGNVTLTYGDVVITTDDAVVKDGEIQLGANARVRFPPPTR